MTTTSTITRDQKRTLTALVQYRIFCQVPTCERVLDDRTAVALHLSARNGQRLSGVKVVCPDCVDTVRARAAQRDNVHVVLD